MSNLRSYLSALVGSSLLLAQPLAAEAQTNNQSILDQVEQYSTEGNQSQNQGLGAAQFSDVSPRDWAFQALDDISRRYGCLRGYPNGTFRGNRALTRYEFAAGLNACLQQIERLIATGVTPTPGDSGDLDRLINEFSAELAALTGRVDGLEDRVSFLEDNQFSTTTKLKGEVLFTLQQAFYDNSDYGTDDEVTFSDRVRLKTSTSFNGEDTLGLRLAANNINDFNVRNSTTRNEPRVGYRGSNSNNVELDQAFYKTPLGDRANLQIWATGIGLDDILSPLNPFASSGGGAISRFGQRNPFIHRGFSENQGIGLSYELSDALTLEAGYAAGDGENASIGIFSGSYEVPVQLTFDSDKFALAASYVHGYNQGGGLGNGTGTGLSNLAIDSGPAVTNRYGVEALFNVSDSFFVGGWVGLADAIVLGTGDGEAWNYAVNLGFPDLGGDGNVLGIVVGRQPYLGKYTNNTTGVSTFEPNNGLHIESFYKIKVSKNIEVTPGVIWLTEPGSDAAPANSDIVIGAIRTRFKF